jgi:hypothetical protein
VEFRISIVGTSAILMHDSKLSNPLDPAAKAVKKLTGKRGKTDEDYAQLARVEWEGGMYWDREIGPYIPADNIWRCLYDAAKKSKKGVKVKEGVFIATDRNPLAYSGPREPDVMWKDENLKHFASAKVGMQRVTRCRPHFRGWATEADGILDTQLLDFEELRQIAETAGSLVGLGDWRPRFGRFTAEVTVIAA